jgi:hypothetical protein
MAATQKLVLFIIVLIFVNFPSLLAQEYILKGHVFDATTHEPLAFVNILANDGPKGATTDIDGKFLIRNPVKISKLKLSYVGYESRDFVVDPALKEQIVLLTRKELELPEVVIRPGINPAHRIIRQVLENRLINDHEKMESFSYTTYEKTIFGPEHDTIPFSELMKTDTSFMEIKKFFDQQHLFIMESVTERKFKSPDKNYNNVIASRVSGMGDPLFVFLMGQLQSTSFYKETIKIAEKDYINPISRGTFNKYYFEIQDTLIEPFPYDTTFIISFRPFMNTNFDGLKGVISISTNNFAIRNVIAEPSRVKSTMTIKIQQLYDYVQNSHWFPLQLNTDIIFQGAMGKGSITLGVGSGSADTAKQDLVGRGKSYVSNINLNPEFRRNQFGFVELDVQPDAYHKPEAVWNQFRVDSLTQRDLKTYQVIDSIGKASNFDMLGLKLDAILNSKIPIGPFDLELDKILRINHHEGLRLGLGAHTNYKFSKIIQVGGYGAYGFKDKEIKYGGNLDVVIDRFHESMFSLHVEDDVYEAGAVSLFDKGNTLLNTSRFRQLLVKRMDHTIMQQVSVGGRVLNYAKLDLALRRSFTEPLYDYRYITYNQEGLKLSNSQFYHTELVLTLRYAYGEKFLKNTRSLVSMGTSYPIIWLALEHGINGLADGQYNFNRFTFKAQKTISFKYLGKTSLCLMAGYIDRDVPYPLLFNGLSSYAGFSFYSPNSFATMRMNEFVSDRYASLFLSHSFGKLLYRSEHFSPQPELVTNMGVGYLRNPLMHEVEGLTPGSYEKGYFESGLIINSILNFYITRLGIGAFYRYGYYAFPEWKDNVAVKLSLSIILQRKK